MRRSFGPRMGGGGGGGNGGGMIKSIHRAVRAGMGGTGGSAIEPNSHFSTRSTTSTINNRSNMNQPLNTSLFLSNNNNSSNSPYVPVTGTSHWDILTPPAITGDHELYDWEYVDESGSCGSDGESSVYGFYDDMVYGSVPSKDEVHHAVSSLQEVLEPVSFGQLMKDRRTHGSDDDEIGQISSQTSFHTSESDWVEPSMHSLQVPSVGKVYDAFHLLQTEPSVQRMVMSLSSDKAVWDAVMNNEVVRELRESVGGDKSISDGSQDRDSNPVTQVLRRIFANTKDKVIEIVEMLTKIVNELIQPMNKDETSKRDDNMPLNTFEENLRSSFILSIMVLLIVVVTRANKC
uniref:uncharacterized protein LOC122584972 isoform X2 n=1 Tax=Erigeron canadensis TaxID=72917 RepID=UPI001CB9C34E|nr:uncharacterized protein LOC122584972 isoform X2 [Erigeron canadensis]